MKLWSIYVAILQLIGENIFEFVIILYKGFSNKELMFSTFFLKLVDLETALLEEK